jgi:hypothetical protein
MGAPSQSDFPITEVLIDSRHVQQRHFHRMMINVRTAGANFDETPTGDACFLRVADSLMVRDWWQA